MCRLYKSFGSFYFCKSDPVNVILTPDHFIQIREETPVGLNYRISLTTSSFTMNNRLNEFLFCEEVQIINSDFEKSLVTTSNVCNELVY